MYRRRLISTVSLSNGTRAISTPSVPNPPCSGVPSSGAAPVANAPAILARLAGLSLLAISGDDPATLRETLTKIS
mgnify:CR=1 FL=1